MNFPTPILGQEPVPAHPPKVVISRSEGADCGRPSVSRLNELFVYFPETGELLRRRTNRFAGATNAAGYRQTLADGSLQYVHRIAWAMTHGAWPDGQIDHINGDKADNSLANLRCVTQFQNCQNRPAPRNNKTGAKGVTFNVRKTRFHASIRVNGKTIHLGNHKTLEEAAAAYAAAAAIYHTHNPAAARSQA